MALNPEFLDNLGQVARERATSTPTTTKNLTPKEPSLAGRALGGALKFVDFIERPYYGLMEAGKDLFGGEKGFSPVKSVMKGLRGKVKTSFSDVLTEAGWQPTSMIGKVTKGLVGFAGGVLLDPITYVGVGAKAAHGLSLGGKAMSKFGAEEFFANLTRFSGKGVNAKNWKVIASEVSPDIWEAAAKQTLKQAYQNPNIFFNKTAMRFAGKEIPGVSQLLDGVGRATSKTMEPLLMQKMPAFFRQGQMKARYANKTLGDMFDTTYSLRHSKAYSIDQKVDLLAAVEKFRLSKSMANAQGAEESQRILQGMGLKKREQVLFETEKFLPTPVRRVMKKHPVTKQVDEVVERLDDLDPLIQEARRYKSAEEFVKAQTALYHGSSGKNIEMIKKDGFKVPGISKERPIGLSLSSNKDVAMSFGEDVIDAYLKPNAKVLRIEDIPKGINEEYSMDYAIKKGYDILDMRNAKEPVFKGLDEIRILNKDAVFNKSQLIDIWNQANKGIQKTAPTVRSVMDSNIDDVFKGLSKLDSQSFVRNGKADIDTFAEAQTLLQKIEKGKTTPDDIKRGFEIMGLYGGDAAKVSDDVLKETWDFIPSKYSLDQIEDPEVRKVVQAVKDKMIEVWKLEVERGLRDPKKVVTEGYMKRILYGDDAMGLGSSRIARKPGVSTVEETMEKFKKGEIDYYFETDAGKVVAARLREHEMMKVYDDFYTYLSENNFVTKVGKDGVKPGWVEVVLGKKWKVQAPPELAKEIQFINQSMTSQGLRGFLNFYDKVQNFWKLTVTSIFPSFHFRNAMSNTYLGFLAGNKNPLTYKQAVEVQMYLARKAAGKEVKDKVLRVGMKKLRLSQIDDMLSKTGVVGHGFYGGDFMNQLVFTKKSPAFVANLPRKAGTAVENNARVALFLDKIGKGETIDGAAMAVKKFLFDYGDLTEFEQTVMKRVIPFYTWLRKNIPLQIEQMVKQPGKYVGALHAQEGVESMTPEVEEKFLPDWMRTKEMMVRVPSTDGKPAFWNPDLPFQDLANMFDITQWVSSTSPLIRGVFEIAMNKDVFRGKPLADQNLPKSKFRREQLKNEFLNQLRFTSYWRKAKDSDRDAIQKWSDFVFGLRTYPFDEALGRKLYREKQSRERSALRKLQQKKNK